MKVLVVDDQAEVRDTTAALIAALGEQPLVAADAEAAIELALEHLPDIVLLDIHMPGVDGFRAARILRREMGSRSWLCALTGAPVDMASASESGFDGVLSKPLGDASLKALFAEFRTLRRGERAPGSAAPDIRLAPARPAWPGNFDASGANRPDRDSTPPASESPDVLLHWE